MRGVPILLGLGIVMAVWATPVANDPHPRTAIAPIGPVWASALPQPSSGLSDLYPGDMNIESDPDVLFVERFDDTVADVHSRWTDVLNGGNMILTSDIPAASPGGTSLRIQGGPSGGHLYKNLAASGMASNDVMYVRYYVKYPSGNKAQHNGIWMGGYNPPLNWPNPQAGVKPAGNERFSAAAEHMTSDLTFDHYDYWMDMRPDGLGTHWGNVLINDPNLKTKLDQWMCVEQMVKLNSPVSASNGEQALWVDGTNVSHLGPGFPHGHWVNGRFYQNPSDSTVFEGFQWRNDVNLNLNYIWLQNYTPTSTLSELEFDHVVVARRYVGCLASGVPPSDSAAPIVSLTSPTHGSAASGTAVTVSATASDDVGVVGVQFKVDGTNLGAEDTTAPYSVAWDTTRVASGAHNLTAVARDAAGHSTTSGTITVTVSNTGWWPETTFGIKTTYLVIGAAIGFVTILVLAIVRPRRRRERGGSIL